ncbi:STAS domain-containing protein [Streptomyces sp. HUAS MG91]|uniref:STAS domain-containing protein n=1 Tax=Streptomyces tabacisoli TaxID=3156398 RepID=A0AAU8ILL8_9ACTN
MASATSDTRVEQHAHITTVAISGDVDLDNLQGIAEVLTRVLSDPRSSAAVIDLSDLTFADSMLLNQLLKTHVRHHAEGRPLRVAGPLNPGVGRLLQITGADAVLDVVQDVGTALGELDPAER